MKFVLYALLIWFIYQFVVKLVIPVYKSSRKIKQGFREMREKMNEQYNQQHAGPISSAQPSQQNAPAGDYIEFEEVK